jgi:hypothetical protein
MQGFARNLGILATGACRIYCMETHCEVLAHLAHFNSVSAQAHNLARGFLV